MTSSLEIGPARPEEWEPALELVFQHLGPNEQRVRTANALQLVRQGELAHEGIAVARQGTEVVAAMVSLLVPGASGLVWPPQTCKRANRRQLEDQLIQYAAAWLRQQGAKLGQTLLAPEEVTLATPLERNGFKHITGLWYLRHDLGNWLPEPVGLTSVPYSDCDPAVFHQTLLRTYEGTLDCPEVNGVRSIEEVITGHQAQGLYDPKRWWLASVEERPVGVLLLADMPEWHGWDLSYLGIVPEARQRRLGTELTRKALWEAQAAGARQLTLAVDKRNAPAWNLYQRQGFQPYDRREVFLAVWK